MLQIENIQNSFLRLLLFNFITFKLILTLVYS